MNDATKVADAIRNITTKMQEAIDSGKRSTRIDANDIIEVLLAIADGIDPPYSYLVDPEAACPQCGEREHARLIWDDDCGLVGCRTCQFKSPQDD